MLASALDAVPSLRAFVSFSVKRSQSAA
jgi:hypothetical protein